MTDRWARYNEYLYRSAELGLSVDVSYMQFPDGYFPRMETPIAEAFAAMTELERGAIANPDEKRQVGHYWLRAPELAPDPALRTEIEETLAALKAFIAAVHTGEVAPERGGQFRNLLVVGIGGSALGPQFFADALGFAGQPMRPYFFDNTDPDGMDRVVAELGEGLAETLVLVISKSGGTKETRNGMLEAEAAFTKAGLSFPRHAVAVTGVGSQLDRHAEAQGWLKRFPMWDWVGGRTSVFSAVGLLPAGLLGFDLDGLLKGAREMDVATRVADARANPAALLALMWYHAGSGKGDKDMVVLPYKDRLGLFAKYLQQLVMESLGKELDLEGRRVNQGIAVYGNKGSTDQHAYIQQLREGPNNFFAVFIEVLKDREGPSLEVAPGVTSGDYLAGFLQGTRKALSDNGRESLTITVEQVNAETVGQLIALFDRAVGFYATLIGINAYHQPGVEAGKVAAERVISLQAKVLNELTATGQTAAEAAAAIGEPGETETVYRLLCHLAANPGRGVAREPGNSAAEDRFVKAG